MYKSLPGGGLFFYKKWLRQAKAEEEGLTSSIPKEWTLQRKKVRLSGFFHFASFSFKPKGLDDPSAK
jgi:hypothetical protein